MLRLYIGNKNYSSWSMRPWVLMRQVGIPFQEVVLRFDAVNTLQPAFKQCVQEINPAGKVPVLVDGGLVVWDTLAIAEYLAEQFAEKPLWPRTTAARAHARSICAEMHAGFTALRSYCPMNIEAKLPDAGQIALRDHPGVRQDLARIVAMWDELLRVHGGPMLFGDFSIADAYFAPVCMRIVNYALPLPAPLAAYVQRVRALSSVRAWEQEALAERDFVVKDEPYRATPECFVSNAAEPNLGTQTQLRPVESPHQPTP